MTLESLEARILALHSGLSLRPTLDRAAEIGSLLREVKDSLPHGEFMSWCRRLPFSHRTANVYLRVAQHANSQVTSTLTLDRFLRLLADRKKITVRDVADSPEVPSCRVITADCREYRWPRTVDLIATDPVWTDPAAYDWLGGFAASRLRPGGLLLVHVGTGTLPDRVRRLEAAGLHYRWTLSVAYNGNAASRPFGCFAPSMGLVLAMSRGRMSRVPPAADAVVVSGCEKVHHPWQQPVKPWIIWLSSWAKKGSLIADPFAGAASIGVACRAIGGLRYLGTEIEPVTARVARKRIAAVAEGCGWMKELD